MNNIIKMIFCNHNFEATKWNNGSYSGAWYERECTCKKCGRVIQRTYRDKNTPRVDGVRIFIVFVIVVAVLFWLLKIFN